MLTNIDKHTQLYFHRMKEKLYRNWDFDFKTFNLVKFTYVAENYKIHNLLHLRNLDENI